jgi:surfactin synthase thioesterase subunit
VVERVAAEVVDRGLDDVLLWGHSTGSAFALATARALLDRGVDVEHVFVGAQLPGDLGVAQLDGRDDAYRHDIRSAHGYLADAPPRLSVPVTVVVAADDPRTADYADRYRDWELLAERVDLHELADGGHYFLRTRPAEAARAVLLPLKGT